MNASFNDKLNDCLQALNNNEPLDSILARYPHDATRLRPILKASQLLPGLSQEPHPNSQLNARRAFLSQARNLRAASAQRPSPTATLQRLLSLAARSLIFAAFVAAIILVATSTSALPDSSLYPVKRSIETVQLSLAPDAEARDALDRRFNQERIREIEALLANGGQAEVAFSGQIEAIEPDTLHIAGLAVTIDQASQLTGNLQIGQQAHVSGEVAQGMLYASAITGPEDTSPSSTPAATATPSPQPQSTASPTEISLPTATPLPADTQEPVAPTPQAAATDDDGSDDDEHQDGDHNDEEEDDEEKKAGDGDHDCEGDDC